MRSPTGWTRSTEIGSGGIVSHVFRLTTQTRSSHENAGCECMVCIGSWSGDAVC